MNLKIILNGVREATTEIINKPLKSHFRGFYISTRMCPGLLCTSLKIGLAKDRYKVRKFLSLAQEINRKFLCGECVVTKHTTFYYRVLQQSNEIEIITIFDTRQDPDKLKKDIK